MIVQIRQTKSAQAALLCIRFQLLQLGCHHSGKDAGQSLYTTIIFQPQFNTHGSPAPSGLEVAAQAIKFKELQYSLRLA
jgi:hypothetical protein